MDEWEAMFRAVRSITRSAQYLQESLEQVIAFARNNPAIFDEPDYWSQTQSHDFHPAFARMVRWAWQGLEALDPKAGWEFLFLDLGDCPEIFRLDSPGGQHLMSEQKFQSLLSHQFTIGCSEMQGCFGLEVADPF